MVLVKGIIKVQRQKIKDKRQKYKKAEVEAPPSMAWILNTRLSSADALRPRLRK